MSEKFKFITLFGFIAICLVQCQAANILSVFTSESRSHLIIHMAYVKALVERGHNITVVTTLSLNDKNPGYHHIHIPIPEARQLEITDMKSQMMKQSSTLKSILVTVKIMKTFLSVQYEAIKDQRFQDFMNNPDNKFDVMLMGYFFNDYQLGLGLHFKCPVILSWMSASGLFVDRYIGNPPEVSYVAATPMSGLPDYLTFTGRLINFLSTIAAKLFLLILDSHMNTYYNDLFPATDYPSMKEAVNKVSLLLCNSHFSEGIVRPDVPAVINVGGIQIKDKSDPLPKDLQEVVNASADHGLIYISFGSNVGSNDLQEEFYQMIYSALADLKQTVLWKWEAIKKPGNSSNIHYYKWLPQDDLLQHPKLRLFITHAGKGSVAESQYHGVPMVAIPIFGDQTGNAEQLTRSGFGLQLNRHTMTAEVLKAAILEVLQNPIYKDNIVRFSKLYTDRPMTARETAVYWIEYVIRHKGAYHMQSPLVHMNGLQYFSLDVIAFLLLLAYLLYRLVKIPTKYVFRKVCEKCSSQKQKVKKQ